MYLHDFEVKNVTTNKIITTLQPNAAFIPNFADKDVNIQITVKTKENPSTKLYINKNNKIIVEYNQLYKKNYE